jgi:hypothetical protein
MHMPEGKSYNIGNSYYACLTSFTMSGLDLALGAKDKRQGDNNHFKGNNIKHNFGDGSRFKNNGNNNHDDNHYTKTIVVHDDDNNNNNNEQTIIVNSNLQGTYFVTQSQIDDIPRLVSQLLNQCASVTVIRG